MMIVIMLRTNGFPVILLTTSVILTAILAQTEDDVPDPASGTNCESLSDSLTHFAIRLQHVEQQVTSTRMICASHMPRACDPKLTGNLLEEKQISEAMKKLRDMETKVEEMDKELGELRQLREENIRLRTRVGELGSYVDVMAKKQAPATCHELLELGVTKSGWYPIDPDGAGVGEDPISVFCDMIPANGPYGHRGVTRIGHNLENQTVEVGPCEAVGCHKTNVTYNGYPMNQIRSLIDISEQCSQEIQYNCLSTPLTKAATYDGSHIHMGSWRGADGAENVYWDGSHSPKAHVCACHVAGNCTDQGHRCNCDAPDGSEWTRDAGFLTNMTALPVVQLTFGGPSRGKKQGANFTLGSLECSPSVYDYEHHGADPDPVIRRKRDKVKKMMKHAWRGYTDYAWGFDFLESTSKIGFDLGPLRMGLTMVEAMDTLFLMGLTDEFEQAVVWVEKELPARLNGTGLNDVRETALGILGGLLSSHALSGDARLLLAAVRVANRLLPAFNSPLELLQEYIDLSTEEKSPYGAYVSLADAGGSLQLEFTHLSKLTGNLQYVHKVMKVKEVLRVVRKINGLYPSYVSAEDGQPVGDSEWQDSSGLGFYYNLLNLWLVSGRQDHHALDMFSKAIHAVTKNVLKKSKSGMLYVPDEAENDGNTEFSQEMMHSSCVWGGLYALWSNELSLLQRREQQQGDVPPPSSLHAAPTAPGAGENRTTDPHAMLEIGRGLGATCRRAYDRTKTKLGPYAFGFAATVSEDAKGIANFYDLEPSTIQSYFLLWRLTGDKKYREWGWDVVQAIEKYCRQAAGYSGIADVNEVPADPRGRGQPAYFMGATLKFLYLLFSSKDLLPLDKWVFNEYGHPLPIAEDRAPV